MIRLLILLPRLTGSSALRAEVYPALHAVVGVAADDVLNLRAARDAVAKIGGQVRLHAGLALKWAGGSKNR